MLRLDWLSDSDLAEWDEFQMESPRGHYCQLSSWLKSFRAFGGKERVVVARGSDGTILGGSGCISWRKWGVEFWTSPAGPVVREGCEECAASILEGAASGAKQAGAMALILQPTVPRSAALPEVLLSREYLPSNPDLSTRIRLPGMAVGEMMWIDFSRAGRGSDWEEGLLATFSQHTRRDIRSALRSELAIMDPHDQEQMQTVYEVIETNGRSQGYATRTWDDLGQTIIEQVKRGQAILFGVAFEKRLVGAYYGVLAGRRLSYMMGGTIRVGGSLKVGHFAQWMAIKKAHGLGLAGYDLTSFGTSGVNTFKMGFNPEIIELVPAQQVVFQPLRYRMWVNVLPMVRRHARFFARLMRDKRRTG